MGSLKKKSYWARLTPRPIWIFSRTPYISVIVNTSATRLHRWITISILTTHVYFFNRSYVVDWHIIILFTEHQEPETPADKPTTELPGTIVRFTSDSSVYRKQLKVWLFSDLQYVFVSRITEDTCLYLSVCPYLVGRIVQFDTFDHHDERKTSVFQGCSYS
jgi:hypothetical protein